MTSKIISENLLAIIVTNSSNSMAPLLSASTCNDDDDDGYGKDDDDEDDDEKEDDREGDGDDFNLVDHVLQLLVRHPLTNPSKHRPKLLFYHIFLSLRINLCIS